MKKINFVNRRNSLREKFFPNAFRVPTEYQLMTWENEGGCVYGSCDNVVIINGVLCETWMDRVRARIAPYWRNVKAFFSPNKTQTTSHI